jgi:hypothetical protein
VKVLQRLTLTRVERMHGPILATDFATLLPCTDAPTAPRTGIGSRGNNSYRGIVDASDQERRPTVARPTFRKRKGTGYYAWHFCTNCPDWPASNYDSRTTAGDPLCDHCQQLEKNRNCS